MKEAAAGRTSRSSGCEFEGDEEAMKERRTRRVSASTEVNAGPGAPLLPGAGVTMQPLSRGVVLGLQRSAGNRLAAQMIAENPAAAIVQRDAKFGPEQIASAMRYNTGRGLTGDLLGQVQLAIGARQDGQLTEDLVRAIAQWQDANGLIPDGKMGPRTMAAIAEHSTPPPPAGELQNPTTAAAAPGPTAAPAGGGATAAGPADPGMVDTIGGVLGRGWAALKEYAFGPVTAEQPGDAAQEPAAPTANDTVVDQASELDTLMARDRLTTEEIRRARDLIDQETDDARRGELFQSLQSKVEYHSQRDNTSTENGKKIGDVMCNLTSLAMALTYLGVPNPDPSRQFEDVLEEIRVQKKLPARTLADGWGGVAAELGAKVDFIKWEVVEGHDWYQANVSPALSAGNAVMASITGHIVRLQAVTPDGLVADDPYGNVKLTKGTGHGWDETNNSKNPNAGEDSVWPWSEVSEHSMLWIAKISR